MFVLHYVSQDFRRSVKCPTCELVLIHYRTQFKGNRTYIKYWDDAYQALGEQLEYEVLQDPSAIPKSRDAAYQQVMLLYVRYIQIFKKLEVNPHIHVDVCA